MTDLKRRDYSDVEIEEALKDSPATNPKGWKRVKTTFEGEPRVFISVRLPWEVLNELREEARRRGIGHTELARMLIIEGLQRDEEDKGKVTALEKRVERLEETVLRDGKAPHRAKATKKS